MHKIVNRRDEKGRFLPKAVGGTQGLTPNQSFLQPIQTTPSTLSCHDQHVPMATKTSSKTATRKPAARGTAAARKPASAAKAKLPRQKLNDDVAPAEKPRRPPPSKSALETVRSPSHEAESVSLIDRKKPSKKAEDGEVKPKRGVLPPISRIRASLETPPTLPKPAPPAKTAAPESPPTEVPDTVTGEKTAAPDATALPTAEEQVVVAPPPPVIEKKEEVRTNESREFQTPRPRMKRSHWIVLLVVCFLVGLLVFKVVLHMINTDTTKARIVHAPTPVETVPVRRQTLEEVIGGSGTVEQFNTVVLTTQISARVLQVPVKIGDIVKKGDLLVRWDDRLIQATLEANRQFVETSNIKIKGEMRQVERYTTLEQKHMGAPLDLEKAEISLADAREQLAKATLGLRQAEIELEHVQMRSPIDGIVLERLVNPDETTHNDQVVIKLGAIETVLMAARVTEEKIHSVQLGLSGEISFPAFPAETFQGKVFKIDPNIDPVTRTFTSYIEIKNPDFRLKPGLSGFARIYRTAKDVLAVPSVAIINPSGDRASVFVVDNSSHANLRKVRLGIVVNATTEITSGLEQGEKVVTVGQLYLQENDKIHSTSKSNVSK